MTEMKKADTLDHVRRPDLPWRISTLTECGRPILDVKSYLTRDELLARLRDFGQARTSLTTCMTCWQTSSRWNTFEANPVDAMRREVAGFRDEQSLVAELRALAALALAHRDEFDAYLTDLGKTANLAERRTARRRRA